MGGSLHELLGASVTDSITGLRGVITGVVTHLSGLNQCLVEPKVAADGSPREGQWIDLTRLDIYKLTAMAAAPCTDAAAGSAALPEIGALFGGGFFAGTYDESGTRMALIVAPKETEKSLPWGKDGETAAASLFDGLANSDTINDNDHQAAQHCRGLRTGGFNDWHLPALDQMSVLRANLFPREGTVPRQTTAEAFKEGGVEAFETGDWYWTSTERTSGYAWLQRFYYGFQYSDGKAWKARVRAVRKCPL